MFGIMFFRWGHNIYTNYYVITLQSKNGHPGNWFGFSMNYYKINCVKTVIIMKKQLTTSIMGVIEYWIFYKF